MDTEAAGGHHQRELSQLGWWPRPLAPELGTLDSSGIPGKLVSRHLGTKAGGLSMRFRPA